MLSPLHHNNCRAEAALGPAQIQQDKSCFPSRKKPFPDSGSAEDVSVMVTPGQD